MSAKGSLSSAYARAAGGSVLVDLAEVRTSTIAIACGSFGSTLSPAYVAKWEIENPDGSIEDRLGKTSGAILGTISRLRFMYATVSYRFF